MAPRKPKAKSAMIKHGATPTIKNQKVPITSNICEILLLFDPLEFFIVTPPSKFIFEIHVSFFKKTIYNCILAN